MEEAAREAAKDENIENFIAPDEDKDAEESFWECRLKPNPHYVGAADQVCVRSERLTCFRFCFFSFFFWL